MEATAAEMNMDYRGAINSTDWNDVLVTFSQMCRICGSTSDFLIPIFDGEGLQHDLDHKILTYLHLKLLKDDSMPLQICYDCVSTILLWHALYLKSRDADMKFQSLFGLKDKISNRAVIISTQQTSEHANVGHSQENSLIPQDSGHVVSCISQQTLLNSDHLLHSNQPASMSNIESPSSPVLASSLLYGYNTDPGLLKCNVVSGMMSSDVQPISQGGFPDCGRSNESSTHEVSTHSFIGHGHSEQNNTLTNLSTHLTAVTEEKSFDDYASDFRKETEKKMYEQTSILKSKSSSFTFDSPEKPFTPPPAEKNMDTSQIQNRVSAIQSTGRSSIFHQQESTCNRSESVLVRNEFAHASFEDKSTSKSSSVASSKYIESSVIIEHPYAGDSRKSTMVSVLRPTCLRRAPMAEVSIGNITVDESNSGMDNTVVVSQIPSANDYSLLLPEETCDDNRSTEKQLLSFSHTESQRLVQEGDKSFDPRHICFHCNKFINNSYLLLAHEKSHLSDLNPPKYFICKFCYEPQSSISDMHLHYAVHEMDVGRQWRVHSNRKGFMCKQCGLMCTTEERLSAHQRSHVDHVELFRHECKTCGQTFNTRRKLSIHLWTHALKPSSKTFKCHICGKGFATKSSVMEHRLKHSDDEKSRAFKCVICGMAFGNNTLLGKHRSTHTKEELARPFKCSFCDKAFARNHTLQIHHLSHSNEKNHMCSQCGKGFKMRNSLIQHMRTHQDPSTLPSYPCNLCGKAFRGTFRLREHLRIHTGDKPFMCSTCGKCFHKVNALHTHEVSHTERRPYKCDVCGKAFKWNKNLRQHKAVHTAPNRNAQGSSIFQNVKIKKPKRQAYQCEICGKELSGKSSLQQHMNNIHNDGLSSKLKPTICSLCGKELSRPGALARHMKSTHGGVKAFKCDLCKREYSTKVACDDHRRSHTGERPYACNVCPKTFASLSNLSIHRSTHSEDRPHKCSYCNKQFKRRAHLVPHLRTHTGEKPYICDLCSRGFAQSNDLHKHRLTHSIEKTYTCQCGTAFRLKRDLTRHQSKHHPQNPNQPTSLLAVDQPSVAAERELAPKKQLILLPGQHSCMTFNSPAQSCQLSTPHDQSTTPSVVVRNTEVMAKMYQTL